MTAADLKNKIYYLTKTNSTSFPAADILIAINNAYERVVSLILNADGRWQFDDNNETDLPIGTTALVADQSDYSIDTTHIRITDIEVKDESGRWYKLQPIDPADFTYPMTTEFQQSGAPEYYDIVGSSVFIYPAPDYSQSASLKIFFQRGPALYTSSELSTGTKSPGINSLYHDLLALWPSYEYAVANGLKNANQLYVEIDRKEASLIRDYAFRNKNERPQMTMKPVRFR